MALAIALALALLAGSATAAVATDADELIRQGVVLRRRGDDAGALQLFQQAFQVEQTAKAMAQIGLAEQALGRWAMAYEHLNRALEDKNDPWIRKNLAVITQSVSRVTEHVTQVEILGGSDGAEVRINGVPRGKLPLAHPVTVSTGTLIIDLVAPGFTSVQRTIVARARETVRESFDAMVPLPVRARSSAPVALTAPVGSASRSSPDATAIGAGSSVPAGIPEAATPERAQEIGSDRTARDQGVRKESTLRTKLKWMAWSLGVGALGLGVFGWVRQNQAGRSFSGSCTFEGENVGLLPGSNKTIADCTDLKNQVDSNYRIELGGLVGAGIMTATGLILWLAEPASGEGERTALSCRPGMTAAHGPWMGCQLRF
jgi:hypothetical protein